MKSCPGLSTFLFTVLLAVLFTIFLAVFAIFFLGSNSMICMIFSPDYTPTSTTPKYAVSTLKLAM